MVIIGSAFLLSVAVGVIIYFVTKSDDDSDNEPYVDESDDDQDPDDTTLLYTMNFEKSDPDGQFGNEQVSDTSWDIVRNESSLKAISYATNHLDVGVYDYQIDITDITGTDTNQAWFGIVENNDVIATNIVDNLINTSAFGDGLTVRLRHATDTLIKCQAIQTSETEVFKFNGPLNTKQYKWTQASLEHIRYNIVKGIVTLSIDCGEGLADLAGPITLRKNNWYPVFFDGMTDKSDIKCTITIQTTLRN